jgi:hypothetical protein
VLTVGFPLPCADWQRREKRTRSVMGLDLFMYKLE